MLTAPAGDHPVEKQQQHGAHDRHDPVRRVVLVPGKHSSEPSADERARDAQEHRDDAATGIAPRHQKLGNGADDEAGE